MAAAKNAVPSKAAASLRSGPPVDWQPTAAERQVLYLLAQLLFTSLYSRPASSYELPAHLVSGVECV
jgi:hypothetical protein